MTWVKICGTTNLEDARAAVEAGADALGFVFAPSPRRISPKDAGRVTAQLPATVERIGVFVNQKPAIILDTVQKAGLTGVQLHGDEEDKQIVAISDALRSLRNGSEIKLIKVVAMRTIPTGESFANHWLRGMEKRLDGFLLDSSSRGKRGGSGDPFDWQEAAPAVRFLGERFKLVIAGGLNATNVREAMKLFRPWGVDVVSGVELAPGKKDEAKLRAFIAAVCKADQEMKRL